MAKMEAEFEESKKKMEAGFEETKKELTETKELLYPFCEKELLILAGEILKWVVKKQGVEDGEGLHLFDPSVSSEVSVSLCIF